jgi:8-oxo-dGTP diphosphatase
MSCFNANKPQPASPDKIVYVVAVALVDRDGRVLLAQRPPGKKMAGLWEFPGGKIEPGETPEAALVREIKEEMDIDTQESCLAPLTFVSHGYDDFHLFMPVFVCRVWKGAPVAREGQSFAWVYPKDFDKYPMPPADIPLIPVMRELL